MQHYLTVIGHLQQAQDAALAQQDLLLVANISHAIELAQNAVLRAQTADIIRIWPEPDTPPGIDPRLRPRPRPVDRH